MNTKQITPGDLTPTNHPTECPIDCLRDEVLEKDEFVSCNGHGKHIRYQKLMT